MKGTIIKGIGGLYTVLSDKKLINAKARGIFRKKMMTPLPGDLVEIEIHGEEATIDKIYERKNELIRPAISNVTQSILVFALKNPDINWDLLNIFLAIMEDKKIKPVILFNKVDIASIETIDFAKKVYSRTPYTFKFINAKEDDIISLIKPLLKDNLTVLMGPSGAGKSTILNSILGEYKMFTGSVSEKIGRGKHTTRHSELTEIEGGLLADTPGFSSMELIGINSKDLMYLMPEFNEFIGECKFLDCKHLKEPNCKIKEEIGNTIDESRYDFYKRSMEKLIEGEKRKWQ